MSGESQPPGEASDGHVDRMFQSIQRRGRENRGNRDREISKGRLVFLCVVVTCAFFAVGLSMWTTATSNDAEPLRLRASADIVQSRADIVDRHGRLLAVNVDTHSLYAQPPIMVDPQAAAEGLARIFPDLDEANLARHFTGTRKFVWIRRSISPEQMQAVHDLGEPGLLFGPRQMRLYPNGPVAAHVLGGAGFGRESVRAAEVLGIAGVERYFDTYLRDPAYTGNPLELSLDLSVQSMTEEVLASGISLTNARGGSAIVMDVGTGELYALASLPDFDPNRRPRVPTQGDGSDSPLFNRAVQGVYELGSVFKIFTVAQALDLGEVDADTEVDIRGPLTWGRFRIRDYRNHGDSLDVTDVIVKSSNIGTARLAQKIGASRQKVFYDRLGFFDIVQVELAEAAGAEPLVQDNWSELTTMTVSYGHGLAVSPMHLAAGYAMIANGGRMVRPTLLRQDGPQVGRRVLSENAAAEARSMLRQVVNQGTASMAEVYGYAVAGKTGTADKPRKSGGYHDDRVIATFAGFFPADDPAAVVVVTLDEPEIMGLGELRRTAGWTAVPVAGQLVRRVAPLLGIGPLHDAGEGPVATNASY